jgi:hypothetical protein
MELYITFGFLLGIAVSLALPVFGLGVTNEQANQSPQ